MDFQGFYPETFQFFFQLGMNNEKTWFEAHKGDYERFVVQPALALIADLDPFIRSISPRYRGISKKMGGSLMRLYRDVRFSRDKTPYKTNLGIQFRHDLAKDVHAPGWYVHLDPQECFVGAGTWHPEPADLRSIRRFIADHPQEWQAGVEKSTAGSNLRPAGESLTKIPKDFHKDHPLEAEIRRKDFLLSRDLDPQIFLSSDLVEVLAQDFRASAPYMANLCCALGVDF